VAKGIPNRLAAKRGIAWQSSFYVSPNLTTDDKRLADFADNTNQKHGINFEFSVLFLSAFAPDYLYVSRSFLLAKILAASRFSSQLHLVFFNRFLPFYLVPLRPLFLCVTTRSIPFRPRRFSSLFLHVLLLFPRGKVLLLLFGPYFFLDLPPAVLCVLFSSVLLCVKIFSSCDDFRRLFFASTFSWQSFVSSVSPLCPSW
jgi:hypothetical protein